MKKKKSIVLLVVAKELEFPSNVVGWIGLNFLPNMEVELQNKDNVLDCN